MIDPHQLLAAYQTVRRDLLAQRDAAGHWIGRLSSSALATATAASALAVMGRHVADEQPPRRLSGRWPSGRAVAGRMPEPRRRLGDTDRSASESRRHAAGRGGLAPGGHRAAVPGHLERPRRQYIDSQGGSDGLRQRYGDDRTFAAPIAANCRVGGPDLLAPGAGVALRVGLSAACHAALPAAGSGRLCPAGPGGHRPGPLLPSRAVEPGGMAVAAAERGAEPPRARAACSRPAAGSSKPCP